MPDIILLDARMPGLGGIEATRDILKLSPDRKIVAMSSVASGVIPSQMLTNGKKVSQISAYLVLSPKTVYSYRYRIFEKLGIRSDVELTILAVKHGLADDTREYDELPNLSLRAS